jgi:hypothetical protein
LITSLGFFQLIEKISNKEPILTVFSVFGEDLQHRCFRKEHYVKTVTQPDIDTVFANNYFIQITGFAEQF